MFDLFKQGSEVCDPCSEGYFKNEKSAKLCEPCDPGINHEKYD